MATFTTMLLFLFSASFELADVNSCCADAVLFALVELVLDFVLVDDSESSLLLLLLLVLAAAAAAAVVAVLVVALVAALVLLEDVAPDVPAAAPVAPALAAAVAELLRSLSPLAPACCDALFGAMGAAGDSSSDIDRMWLRDGVSNSLLSKRKKPLHSLTFSRVLDSMPHSHIHTQFHRRRKQRQKLVSIDEVGCRRRDLKRRAPLIRCCLARALSEQQQPESQSVAAAAGAAATTAGAPAAGGGEVEKKSDEHINLRVVGQVCVCSFFCARSAAWHDEC